MAFVNQTQSSPAFLQDCKHLTWSLRYGESSKNVSLRHIKWVLTPASKIVQNGVSHNAGVDSVTTTPLRRTYHALHRIAARR